MDWTHITASVTAILLSGYLIAALLKPEWFS
jgi:K+-transporting ATPase KdpF subunit